jgi:hypothetical protein
MLIGIFGLGLAMQQSKTLEEQKRNAVQKSETETLIMRDTYYQPGQLVRGGEP